MELPQAREYIDFLTRRYPSVSSIWLMGSRASGSERPDSDWDLLAFADGMSFTAMQHDLDVRAPGIDLLVLTDGDRFEQPWREGPKLAKGGYLSTWKWSRVSETQATYFSTRLQGPVPATRLWVRG